jgi:DNA repair protein RadC
MAPSILDSGPDTRRAESTLCSQRTGRARCAGQSRRYRLHKATWTVVREPGQPSPRLLSAPAAVAELARDLIRAQDDDKEHVWVVLLSAQNQYLLHTEVSVGSQSATIVHPREVFGPALREGAANLLLIHNHPSGDPTRSREDLRLTRQLVDAAQLLDLRIHDHLIMGKGTEQWVSLAEQGGLS